MEMFYNRQFWFIFVISLMLSTDVRAKVSAIKPRIKLKIVKIVKTGGILKLRFQNVQCNRMPQILRNCLIKFSKKCI